MIAVEKQAGYLVTTGRKPGNDKASRKLRRLFTNVKQILQQVDPMDFKIVKTLTIITKYGTILYRLAVNKYL